MAKLVSSRRTSTTTRNAGLVEGAVRVPCTPARRQVSRNALTNGDSIFRSASRAQWTRVRTARVKFHRWQYSSIASDRWVAFISVVAYAQSLMTDNGALGIGSTNSGLTGVDAAKTVTNLRRLAVRIVQAFWSASLQRLSEVAFLTGADSTVPRDSAYRHCPARRWLARVFWLWWWH